MNETPRVPLGKLSAALVASLVCLAPFPASAYNCTLSVPAVNVTLDPTSLVANTTPGAANFTCSRAGGESTTLAWSLGANEGVNVTGASQNRARLGASAEYVLYNTWWTNGTTEWRGFTGNAASRITGSLSIPTTGAGGAQSGSGSYLLIVPGNLATWPAPGTYTDTVNVRFRKTSASGTLNPNPLTTSFQVSVIVPATCRISVPPGNVNFTYVSLQTSAAPASTTFGVRCTNTTPYTMSLDGTQPYNLLGLNYTLSLPGSGTGTGVTQTHTINGNIAANQSGTCATGVCNGTQTRTLTIAY